MFITLDLLVWLRSAINEHIAIGREVLLLNRRYEANIDADKVRKAYFKFCSLMDLNEAYKCCLCGYYPVILTFDVIRKCAFKMQELSNVRDDEGVDMVNHDQFWENINKLCIEESIGGISSKVQPSLNNWAPWIPEISRKGPMVYNTEYKKGSSDEAYMFVGGAFGRAI